MFQRVKRTFGCVWVVALAMLSGCGTSDPKSSGAGGENQGVSGASADAGRSGSSDAGSNGSLGGRAGASGAGGSGQTNGGAASGGSATAGGNGDAPPDIPPSTLLSDVDGTEQGALCDWHASVFGGYGHVSQCGMGMVVFPADQAMCIETTFPAYCKKATVGQFEACVLSGVPSHGCDLTDECRRLFCP